MFELTPALTAVQAAHKSIIDAGLNQVRCSLTGAPYATVESDEILMALEGDFASNPSITASRLYDNWELRVLALSSQPSPLLRGAQEKALVPLLSRGHSGNVRLLVYLTTRLFYPHLGSTPMHTDFALERKEFAATAYDFYMRESNESIEPMIQKLIAVDSYCSMPHWHKMWIFDSRFSAYGIHKADVKVRKAFAEPAKIMADSKALPAVITFLFELMLYASSNDSNVGRSGNRLSQQLLTIDGRGPIDGVPMHQKTLSQADIDRMARAKAVNSKQELRVAWSATHGKGYLTARDAVKKSVELPKDSKASTPKAKKEKPKSALDLKFDSALAAFTKSSNFADLSAAFGTMLKKD